MQTQKDQQHQKEKAKEKEKANANAKQENQYYVDLRKKIEDDYDALGVINDYLTVDIDIQSAAIVYDLSTVLTHINNHELLNINGVLLFDIYGNFNLFKPLPSRVKFQNFMNFTQDIEIPEDIICSDRRLYIYEFFQWSENIIDKIFLGKINKRQIDNIRELFLSIKPCDIPIINDILRELHTILPEKNMTLFEYICDNKSNNKNQSYTRKRRENQIMNKTHKRRRPIIS